MTNEQRNAYMTVVFKTDVESFEQNPLHIKSEFGPVAAICRGDALKELSTQAELLKACEWQTIESAPKEGTKILATRNYNMPQPYEIIWWHNGGWNANNALSCFPDPTHWMPLPKPPTAQGA